MNMHSDARTRRTRDRIHLDLIGSRRVEFGVRRLSPLQHNPPLLLAREILVICPQQRSTARVVLCEKDWHGLDNARTVIHLHLSALAFSAAISFSHWTDGRCSGEPLNMRYASQIVVSHTGLVRFSSRCDFDTPYMQQHHANHQTDYCTAL